MSSDSVVEHQRRASSFGAIAEDYDRLRPTAPEAALTWLLPPNAQTVVDVGAGTGLLTRALIPRVPQVIAVEPDARMRAVLARRSPAVSVYDGRGEAIPLPDASADCVLFASSWHWVDPARAVPEIGRVLRVGGHLGALWTSRDRRVDWVRDLDDNARAADAAGAPAGPTAGTTAGAATGATRGAPTGAADVTSLPRRSQRRLELPAGSPFAAVVDAEFTFERVMAVADIVALMATYSGTIVASTEERAERLDHTRRVLAEHAGSADTIAVPHRCICSMAVRTA